MPAKTLRTLVVEDEPVSRRVLLEDLAEMDDISVVGEAENGQQALQQIEELRPDLVLLDIQMPLMDGFQMLRQLRGPLPSIIFVTAYSEHALNAFEVGAVDYLLKPVSPDRLQTAVERAQAAQGNRQEAVERVAQTLGAATAGELRGLVKIVARKGEDYYLLDPAEVFAFQADREIVWIRTHNKSYMATQTLQAIDERFSGTRFQRIHRSVLVNLDKVRRISPLSSQRWLLTLTNGLEYTVSKRQTPPAEGHAAVSRIFGRDLTSEQSIGFMRPAYSHACVRPSRDGLTQNSLGRTPRPRIAPSPRPCAALELRPSRPHRPSTFTLTAFLPHCNGLGTHPLTASWQWMRGCVSRLDPDHEACRQSRTPKSASTGNIGRSRRMHACGGDKERQPCKQDS